MLRAYNHVHPYTGKLEAFSLKCSPVKLSKSSHDVQSNPEATIYGTVEIRTRDTCIGERKVIADLYLRPRHTVFQEACLLKYISKSYRVYSANTSCIQLLEDVCHTFQNRTCPIPYNMLHASSPTSQSKLRSSEFTVSAAYLFVKWQLIKEEISKNRGSRIQLVVPCVVARGIFQKLYATSCMPLERPCVGALMARIISL